MDRASALECDFIATGHYAKIKNFGDYATIQRGADLRKDQSYFLYSLSGERLTRIMFPLGDYTKEDVRRVAVNHGLPSASRSESQDVCFISGKVGDWFSSQGIESHPGLIVDNAGAKIGEHTGIHNYTVGQRKGIGVGGAEGPLYVVRLNRDTNQVVVGKKEELYRTRCSVNSLREAVPGGIKAQESYFTQIRYKHTGSFAKILSRNSDSATIELSEGAVIAPGQSAVFYDAENSCIIGGGVINYD